MASDSSTAQHFRVYHYTPSLAAAAAFIVLFLATTALHTFQLIKKRTWYFIPFLVGGFFEFIGYIFRALSAHQSPNWTLGPYIGQTLLLLLAPALFAASIYMVLGRIVLLTDGEAHALIRARWMTKVFVAGDVLSFLVQSAGGGMLAQSHTASSSSLGSHMITVGLVLQLLSFGFFILVAGLFHHRMRLYPTARSKALDVPWERYMWVLYAASVLIVVRSVFRVAEYVQGNDGRLLGTEAYLYVFDATLMWVVMVLFNVAHPSGVVGDGRQLREGRLGVDGEGGFTMAERA